MSTSRTWSSVKPKELYMIDPKVVRALDLFSLDLTDITQESSTDLTRSVRSTGMHSPCKSKAAGL